MDLADRGMVPFHNLGFVWDYISSASRQKEYATRIVTVLQVIATVNALCAMNGQVGAFAAGCFVNAKLSIIFVKWDNVWGKNMMYMRSLNNL